MRRRSAGWLLLVLAACSDTPVLLHPAVKLGGFDLSELGYAVGGRDLAVVARGMVGGVGGAALAAAVAGAMTRAALPVDTRPTAHPGPSAHPLYRVVWDFAPAPRALPDDLCHDPGPAAPSAFPAGAALRVHVAFCRGTTALSSVYARSGPSAVGAPGFATLITVAVREVFTPEINDGPMSSARFVPGNRLHPL